MATHVDDFTVPDRPSAAPMAGELEYVIVDSVHEPVEAGLTWKPEFDDVPA